jgi:hypothetical protein
VCSAATEAAQESAAPAGNSTGPAKPSPAKKEPSPAKKEQKEPKEVLQLRDGRFVDHRWVGGRWVLSEFANPKTGEMDWPAWDSVIDAEIARRQMLEQSPIPSTNEEPVLFDTAEIPWWAWIRRFHLPEAEKLNGRACMVGYFLALGVDKLTGAGLVDQQSSFLGLLSLHVVVFAVLLFPTIDRIQSLRGLIDEATFYDKQWSATWDGQRRPSENQ